jgi:hypothetical protein
MAVIFKVTFDVFPVRSWKCLTMKKWLEKLLTFILTSNIVHLVGLSFVETL